MTEQTIEKMRAKLEKLRNDLLSGRWPNSRQDLEECFALLPAPKPTPGPLGRCGFLIKDANGVVIGMAYSSDGGACGGTGIPDGIENAKLFASSWSKDRESKAARKLFKGFRTNNDLCIKDRRLIDAHLAEYPACS